MATASIPGIELGAELGRGSHSAVLRGTRENRTYAVKLPLDAATGAERELAYRRFLREAIALARARHASLPDVMEIGRAKGVPYLVMELAAGETLAERLERGPLGEADVVGLARQIAGALGAIHAAGLVHRDVKPQNIVFDAQTGIARLIDLGAAAFLHGAVGLVGTPAYAAPELLAAEPRPADVRTDLYSLGRVLFECLTAPVVRKGIPGGREIDALLHVSPELARIVSRLLAPDPDARQASVGELRGELDALSSALPSDPPGWARERVPASLLLGRANEVDQLRRAWSQTRRASQVIFLRGAPGTGKTRLAKAFVAELAESRAMVLSAACHPRDPRAFSAVRQLVDGYLLRCDQLAPAERIHALSEVRKLGGEHGALLKLLSPAVARLFRDSPTIPASANAEQAFSEGLSEFLGKLVRHVAPAAVFVDDVQWLDPSSRRVLARAVAEAPKRALFLYGARSGDAAPEVQRFSDLFIAKTTTMDLPHLEGAHLIEIARDFLSAHELAPEVEHAILRLSDGTPLSVLVLLQTLVDEGVLLPHWGRWQLDAKALSGMHLPRETASLLARRIGALDAVTRSVLAGGAIIGMAFEDSLLSAAAHTDARSVVAALAEARRADLVEDDGGGSHRFFHHTIRDAMLAGLDDSGAQEIHRRVAEALDHREGFEGQRPRASEIEHDGGDSPGSKSTVFGEDEGTTDADRLYRLAHHYGAGGPGALAERVAETNILAGQAAVARFDNERAIEFFEAAGRALLRSGSTLTPTTRLSLGDARLRSGALDQALIEFEAVLSSSRDALLRAGALVRIATIHDMRFDSNRAWAALEEAFRALGEELPKETPLDAAATAASWLRRGRRKRLVAPLHDRTRDEILCELYYQAGRVAFVNSKPGLVVLTTLRALEPAERLGPSSALAKSHLMYSFVLTVLGLRGPGRRYLESAEALSRELRDPVVYAHTLQVQSVIAAWDGRMGDAVEIASRCLLEYGNWRELNEVCLLAWTLHQIETARGRDIEAWRWLDLPIQRVNRHEGQPVVHEFLLLAARGALVALGREDETTLMLRRLEQVTVSVPKDSGTHVATFGPRVRVFTERGELGADFQALTRDFRNLGQNPKQVHLNAFEYYLHVAHARVHACLRAKPGERAQQLRELAPALAELEAASRKIPLFRAHVLAVRAYEHFFHGRRSEALHEFEAAERIAIVENAPWVLYAVHRGRAHLLRADGNEAAARDHAVLAETTAREHGSVYRARWVREEFGLRPRRSDASEDSPSLSVDRAYLSDETTSLHSGASRARRQLRALLRISQARAHDLEPDLQPRLVVDELVQALRAERGFLFLTSAVAVIAVEPKPGQADVAQLELVAGRDASRHDVAQTEDFDRTTVKAALELGADTGEVAASFCLGTTPRRSVLAAPLVVDEVAVGIVYVDRALGDGVFTEGDGEVLSALAGQVSIALELAQALRARERAEESRRAADKMEAVARLARGVGHDVNNMLSAVSLTTEAMAQTPGANEIVGDDIRAIQHVLKGAGEIARSLRDIGQGDFGRPEVLSASARVERLAPVIAGLLGAGISLDTRLSSVGNVFIDAGQLDQIVTNLAINARDAMPNGGRLSIEVEEVELDEAYAREHPRATPGKYVKLCVSDTGHGMDAGIRDKIFEPYFTTKSKRGGTGLGLSSVYWIVSRSGGHIDVVSTPGAGTTFALYFPVTDAPVASNALSKANLRGDVSNANDETAGPQARTRANT
jgi:eukaryotic-like serine/threonine-protein kinase